MDNPRGGQDSAAKSFVYPVRSLLDGRIHPAPSHSLDPDPDPIPQSHSAIALPSRDSSPDAPPQNHSKRKKRTRRRARSASASDIPPPASASPENTARARHKTASHHKANANYRHFPSGDNPYFSPSFSTLTPASTTTAATTLANIESMQAGFSAEHVLGHPAALSLQSPPHPLLPSPTLLLPPSISSASLSVDQDPAPTPTAPHQLPKEQHAVEPDLTLHDLPQISETLIDVLATPLARYPGTFNGDDSPNDGELSDDELDDVPFNLSEYVHLPPLPSSSSNSERASSATSQSGRSGSAATSNKTGSHALNNAMVDPRPAASSQTDGQPTSSSSRLLSQPGTGSSRGDSSGGLSGRTSVSSDEHHVSFRFSYMQDENGNHVVVGREGKLQRCEDEPIRTPGAVQGYGVLIAVDELQDTLVVRQVSENSTELLGLPPKYLFGLECFTDTLPDSQAGILWDNIQFLNDPDKEEEETGPHVFLLSGLGAPGSAYPYEGESEDGKRSWSCWCAVHRAQGYSPSETTSAGLIVMEFELEKDMHNPLYPPFRPGPLQPSGMTSPSTGSGSHEGSSTEGSDRTARPTSTVTTSTPTLECTGSHSTAPSGASIESRTSSSSSSETSLITRGPLPASLHGLEGDDDWTPSLQDVIESTTSRARPLPALERLRKMTQAASGSPADTPTSGPGKGNRRTGRKGRGTSAVGMMDVFAVMAQINEQLGACTEMEGFLKVVVGVIKDLTQFHRVMIYKFDELWNGQVVAELVDWTQSHDLFMGLHFPASDIPAQARELYKLNKVRLLYNRAQPTARIVVRNKEDLETPLNMTHCYLRAMSPIHIQYLENMGVRASMSVSIIAFGQLWGLVTCHSYGAHGMRVSFPIRQMLRLLCQSISKNIERLSYAQRLYTRKLINTMATEHHPTGYIVSNADDLLGLFDADFGILVIGEGAKILGPNQHGQEILIMAEFLRMKQYETIQASQAVVHDFPDLQLNAGLEIVAGLLYVPLSGGGKDFIAFLRKGQPRKVHWAGKPYKDGQDSEAKLEPRKSFKTWSEIVAGRCRAWTEEQLETAGVVALVYGKFIEVWRQKENALQTTKLTNLLLSNASHEVRTPLNHIINYLEMALSGPLDIETRDNLSRSHAASKSLLFTINDLLDLTRLESGNETSFNEPFDLHVAIEEAIHVYRKEAGRRNIEFVLDLEHSPTIVVGDSKKIRTVVQNLTANALKYTNAGSITVCCMVFGEPAGLRGADQAAIEILVADTGCGIETEKLESIFREFEQVESSEPRNNAKAGVGLGLAVVARIVAQLGGQLRVDSKVNEGSRFSFLIPLALPLESGSGSGRSSQSSGSVKPSPPRSGPSSLFDTVEMENLVQALASSPIGDQERPGLKAIEAFESARGRKRSGGSAHITVDPIAGPVPGTAPKTEVFVKKRTPRQATAEIKDHNSVRGQHNKSRDGPQLRVLIVEDNEINANLLAKRLSTLGHAVVNTYNGQEGLDKVTNDRSFDLVLMDIQMPILDGFESTRRIREVEQADPQPFQRHSQLLNGRIPIFAVSASLREEQVNELRNYGVDGWILKPIDFKRLGAILSGITDADRREKDVYHPGCSWEAGGWLHGREGDNKEHKRTDTSI